MATLLPCEQASISSARRQTRRIASSSASSPENAAAAISPSEKPAQTSARTPCSCSARAQARSTAYRQGWVLSVRDSVSLSPSKHWASVPGRSASAASNTARAAGLDS